MASTEAPASADKTVQDTFYMILRVDDSGYWSERGVVAARSAGAAVRVHIEATSAGEGVYIAVPERSWKPITVTVETQTILKLDTA